ACCSSIRSGAIRTEPVANWASTRFIRSFLISVTAYPRAACSIARASCYGRLHALLPRLCIKNTNRPITIALSANQRRSTGFRGNHRMNKNNQLTAADIASLARRHSWAATGVSDYPPRDPLVGQSRFFKRYRTFIHTVDQDADNFAHVFAVEAEWGRG